MDTEIINSFLGSLSKKTETNFNEEQCRIGDSKIVFNKGNFSSLTVASGNRVVYIDGGDSVLFETPQAVLFFIRLAAVHYKGRKRTKVDSQEFFCLSKVVYGKDEKLFYDIELFTDVFDKGFQKFKVDSQHETLIEGRQNAEQGRIVDLVRRMSEILFAGKVMRCLDKNDLIVLDGSFLNLLCMQDKAFWQVKEKSDKLGVNLAALSKTSSLVTLKGNNPMHLLQMNGPDKAWLYDAGKIFDNSMQFRLYFCKLHDKAQHVFKMESIAPISNQINYLASHARDPVFLGYPYGLVDADQFARVSNTEKERLRTKMAVLAGKNFDQIKENIAAQNAHEILDRIKF